MGSLNGGISLQTPLFQASGYAHQVRWMVCISSRYISDFSFTRKQHCQWPDIRPLGGLKQICKKQILNCFANITSEINEVNE